MHCWQPLAAHDVAARIRAAGMIPSCPACAITTPSRAIKVVENNRGPRLDIAAGRRKFKGLRLDAHRWELKYLHNVCVEPLAPTLRHTRALGYINCKVQESWRETKQADRR